MLRLTLAWLHLLALGIGFWAVFARGQALRQAARELPATDALRRAFLADGSWGIAAILWLSTGLWRWLGATEKSSSYYLANHIFLTKMALFVVVIALEIWPMIMLIRWRKATGGTHVDARVAQRIATISYVQGTIVAIMIFTAVAMARGYGIRG